MGVIYKFVPRAAKQSGITPMKNVTPVKRPTVERGNDSMAEKPYQLCYKRGFDSNNIKPYSVEFEVKTTDPGFKTRIHNILDSNNYYISYRFNTGIKKGQIQVKAVVELNYGHSEQVMLSVCTEEFYEQADKFSLVELGTQTVRFTNEASVEAFITAFEQTLQIFLDKKYEDYVKLKARLIRRD